MNASQVSGECVLLFTLLTLTGIVEAQLECQLDKIAQGSASGMHSFVRHCLESLNVLKDNDGGK